MCECQDMSMDLTTPRNAYLSAFYKRSFAYHTVKNRMPIILTQLIDMLSRNKEMITQQFGGDASEDLKTVIGEISKLKYEIQTNKPLAKLQTQDEDIKLYNNHIDKQATEEGETTYFNTIWLLTECYMYRRIREIFSLTESFKNFDYFQSFKEEQFHQCNLEILKFWKKCISDNLLAPTTDSNKLAQQAIFQNLIKAILWGNKCDLSISLGKILNNTDLLFNTDADNLDKFILTDDRTNFIEYFFKINESQDRAKLFDIVLDNSGYELIQDLCFATAIALFCSSQGPGQVKIRFHVKAIPWFISDVTKNDFSWTVEQIAQSPDTELSALGKQWKGFLNDNIWEVVVHSFWTTPFEFKYMEEVAPDLYSQLSQSDAIIFKGDLNYRKLFGEKNWDPCTPSKRVLKELNFKLSNILVIRTIKADIVVGLKPGIVEECEKQDAQWMANGDYGVIHFVNSVD
ncbi:hypothetical protein ABEB36_001798 [Hypothenemus hampei]|uniref:Sugar phosphate phosphatase n=1 Tax=Hypothenemus hampei TaxID=57062 RepID=A0ABD1FIX9_HYPHA